MFGTLLSAGQYVEQRRRMADKLKEYGFADEDEYPTVEAFMTSLVQFYRQDDISFFVDPHPGL